MNKVIIVFFGLLISYSATWAGEADVLNAKVTKQERNIYRFEVTVRHHDEGWQHYADRWEILGPQGTLIATRTLLHPHVDEQPFTRSLSGVKIPHGIDQISIQAHDSKHDYGGTAFTVELPR